MTLKLTSNQKKDKNGLTEEEFLRLYNPDKYPKPSLTADICVFKDGKILLIKRGGHPYIDHWALPGGFANKNEELSQTARRELQEETSLELDDFTPVGVYSKPGRDPRGWVVSAAYGFDLKGREVKAEAADDAKETGWFEIIRDDELYFRKGDVILNKDDLAFDHYQIITDALKVMGL